MKIYFAGSFSGVTKELEKIGIKNKLYSFHNEKKQARDYKGNLMLDSGAFSVLTQGAKIDIDELIAFIKEVKPNSSIQLDVIGDEEKTWANYLYMKERITEQKLLPVIHYKASDKHIKRVLNENAYTLLGGLVPLTRKKKELFSWLDYLYSTYKLQNYKIHLLGVTTKSVLERYPVYSSDSSSALSINRYPSSDKLIIMKQKTLHYKELYTYGVEPILELEQYITKLWEKRGIKWE